MLILTLITTLIAALPLLADTPDLIVLANGKEIECRVLFEDEETVVYTKKRKAEELARSEVSSIQSIERSLQLFLDRFDVMDDENVAGLLELANFCESRELFGEARHLRIRALTLDPTNELAWTKLGGSFTERRGWRMKVRGRHYTIEQLRERVADWKNAMEIPTAHFLIKTDMSPERALDLAIDIERAYLTFYGLLGGALRLYPFDEVPEVNIYASVDDYPNPRNPGDNAWFEPLANVMHVNGAWATEMPHAAVAEFTDVLLWNALRRSVGKTGAVPPWVRDGLGQAFGAAFRRDPGHASWDLAQPIRAHFVTQADAEDPLSLKDVVRASYLSRESGTNARLYTAQSYTLVHFLAQGDNRAMRSGFGQYLVGAFTGKNSTTHLEKALGMKTKELSERWLAYVKVIAGR